MVFCYLVLSFSIFIFIYIYISYPLKFRRYWFSSVIIYVTKTKFRHFYPKKFLSIRYFNILFNISVYFYCVNFFPLRNLIVTVYFSLLHTFFSRYTRVSIGTLLRLLSLSFFQRLIFPDSNENIWQVKKWRFLVNI